MSPQKRWAGALAVAVVLIVAPPASAEDTGGDEVDLPAPAVSLGSVARAGLDRTRRAVALGPFAGLAAIASDGELAASVSFGIGISLFKVPIVPDRGTIEQIVRDRARARLKRLLADSLRGGEQPSPEQLEDLAREVYQEVLDEFMAERAPKVLEKPRAHLHLEAARTLSSGAAWQSRITATVGIGPISLGPTLGIDFAGDTSFLAGGETHLQILPGGGPRSPIIDLFLRADVTVGDDDDRGIAYYGGARLLLDIL